MASQIEMPKKELFSLYAIASLFSGGRLFVGAISVLYILSHGITVNEFAAIKSLQVAAFLIFDIPVGLYIKRVGYKKALYSTFFLSILGLIAYVFGSSLYHFLLAELLITISLCLYPTTYADYTMNILKRNPNILIEKIFHRIDMYVNMATLVCGGLGGYLFTLGRTVPYFSGILLQILGFYLVMGLSDTETSTSSELNKRKFISDSLSKVRLVDSCLLIPVLLLIVIQIIIQPLYHYWQPLFYEVDPQISGTLLGGVFVSYSLCAIIMNYFFSVLATNSFFRSQECIFSMLILSVIFYFTSAISNDIFITFISFTSLQGILFTSLTCISIKINHLIDDENRPVILKFISFLSRAGTLIFWVYIQIFFSGGVRDLYLLFSTVLLIGTIATIVVRATFFKTSSDKEVKFERIH